VRSHGLTDFFHYHMSDIDEQAEQSEHEGAGHLELIMSREVLHKGHLNDVENVVGG